MRNILITTSFFIATFVINGCGSSSKKQYVADELILNSNYTNTFVYDKNSPYKNVLKGCISIKDTRNSCSLNKLPLLMQDSDRPTKKQIMQRVVVSHQWMGDRFAEMLDILPNDIKKLLGATTAIVIDDDVRPAYYWRGTGAIHLDPRYLWLTSKEVKTITKKDDYRNNFGKDLKFISGWRYIKNNKYAYRYYRLDSNVTRSIDDIKYSFACLLYHELSHANDFTRFNVIENANKNNSIFKILNSDLSYNEYISTKLYKITPLKSQELKKIGSILYHGEKASSIEKNYETEEIAQFFDEDKADDLYAYSNQYEDLAMLFEATMMKYHYGIQRDLAFMPKPTKDSNLTCNDYIVVWGKRDRIADEEVRDRDIFIVKSILPNETDWDDFFAKNLSSSKELEKGKNWCDTVNTKTKKKLFKKLEPKELMSDNMIPPYL